MKSKAVNYYGKFLYEKLTKYKNAFCDFSQSWICAATISAVSYTNYSNTMKTSIMT